jgi:hypothetical protein
MKWGCTSFKVFFFVWMQWKERATTSTYNNAIIVCNPPIFYISCKNYIKTSQMLLSINNQIISKAFSRDQVTLSFLSWATIAFYRFLFDSQFHKLFLSNIIPTFNIPNSYILNKQICTYSLHEYIIFSTPQQV